MNKNPANLYPLLLSLFYIELQISMESISLFSMKIGLIPGENLERGVFELPPV